MTNQRPVPQTRRDGAAGIAKDASGGAGRVVYEVQYSSQQQYDTWTPVSKRLVEEELRHRCGGDQRCYERSLQLMANGGAIGFAGLTIRGKVT